MGEANVSHISAWARDLGVNSDTLEQFAQGRATLAPDIIDKLVANIFDGHAVYDATVDRLRPALKQDPRSLGIRPEPIADPKALPSYQPPMLSGSAMAQVPRPVTPVAAKPKRRGGWLHAWL